MMLKANRRTAALFVAILVAAVSCKEKAGSSYCKTDESVLTGETDPSVSGEDAGEDAGNDAGSDTGEDADRTYENDFTGLYCFKYSTVENSAIHVNIVNYWADCGGPFQAQVTKQSLTGIEVTVRQSDCSAYSGCYCPYDFSMDVTGVYLKSNVTLTVGMVSCLTESVESVESSVLRLSEAPSGFVCQYFGSITGTRHAFCNADKTCDEGLVCTEEAGTLSGTESVCLVPCESESDCPVPTAFTCDQGVCHVLPGMTRSIQ